MSALSSDPRRPQAAKRFYPEPVQPDDLPFDFSGLLAILFGVAGVMLKQKAGSWISIIFVAQSLANMKNMENDLKQIVCALTFSIMGLVTNYFGPGGPFAFVQQR